MPDIKRSIGLLLRPWPWLLITGFGLALLWPTPLGVMPLSADHTVHLTRVVLWAEALREGALHSWSPHWFFGTPTGDLYPVLGDLIVVLVKVLSLGLLPWSMAYAFGVSLVFVSQGWAMLAAGRALRMGPWPGLVAAALLLSDAGQYREGGWIYTMSYGVWPQALATALGWWGIGRVIEAAHAREHGIRWATIGAAGLLWGGALLAHPMALVHLAFASVLVVLVLGHLERRATAHAFATVTLALALAFAIAAWWLLPMLQYKAWMASYGWLGAPLQSMAQRVLYGHWFDNAAPVVGFVIAAGVIYAALLGSRPMRLYAALALVLWVFASRDVLEVLRLDRISEGFTHIQYQRMLIAAKPGLFLAAGGLIGVLVELGVRGWQAGARRKLVGVASFALAGGLAAWMAVDQAAVARKHGVGVIQQHRLPDAPAFDSDYEQMVAWLTRAWSERDGFFRVTVDDHRNTHWFVDATVDSGAPLYKQGFTPGDNFVHKPESGGAALLQRGCVRYEIRRSNHAPSRETHAQFGTIHVRERSDFNCRAAWLSGPGTLEVVEADWLGNAFTVRVSGSDSTSRLVFAVAGYPRWHIHGPSGAVEWFEVPIVGDAPIATQAQRQAGKLRGGKARGDDGTEPTLIAAELADHGDGLYSLTYQQWTAVDIVAALVSFVTLALLVLARWRPAHLNRAQQVLTGLHHVLQAIGRPVVLLVLGGVMLLTAFIAWRSVSPERARWASLRVFSDGAAAADGIRPGLIKTDMLIRPALVPHGEGEIAFEVELDDALDGWVAIDDDAGQMRSTGRYRLHVEIEIAGEVAVRESIDVRHRPGRQPITVDTLNWQGQRARVRVRVEPFNKPPPMGFDLELGRPGEAAS